MIRLILAFSYGKCKTDDMIVEIKKDIFIRTTESAKFLGIVFDRRMKWEKQINEVLGKAHRIIQIMKYLNKVSWSMEVNTALLLYKNYVRSIIEYGLFIYFPKQVTKSLKIERCQYKGIRVALGYRNSTPTNVLMEESKLPYLQDWQEMVTSIERTGKKFLAENVA